MGFADLHLAPVLRFLKSSFTMTWGQDKRSPVALFHHPLSTASGNLFSGLNVRCTLM